MNIEEAIREVGAVNPYKPFLQNTKMPGPSYDLPASACKRGSMLANDKRSMCHPKTCYAKRAFFRWPAVKAAAERRLASLNNPRWVEAFTYILHTRYRDETHFRWHASGDIQSHQHFRNIIQVARNVQHIRFWIPTHEPYKVADVIREPDYRALPDNLCVRISADALYSGPSTDWPLAIRGLPTSTVHASYGNPILIEGRRSFECRAHDRDNACGPCRACWKPALHNISYPKTTERGVKGTGKRSPQLRIFQ